MTRTQAHPLDGPLDDRVDAPRATEVLTFDEARARIRVGRSTMFRLIQEGALPSFKIGRSLRFTGEDVEKFLSDRRAS